MGANAVSLDRSTCRTTAWYLSPDFEASSFWRLLVGIGSDVGIASYSKKKLGKMLPFFLEVFFAIVQHSYLFGFWTIRGATKRKPQKGRSPIKMAWGAVGEWQPTTEPGQAAGFAVKVHGLFLFSEGLIVVKKVAVLPFVRLYELLPPAKTIGWNLKITPLKRNFIFQTSIFGVPCQFSGV